MKKLKYIGLGICVVLLLGVLAVCLRNGRNEHAQEVDSLCIEAYRVRYVSIDSVQKDVNLALRLCGTCYDEGRARVLNRLAFVRYQKMDFDGTLHLLDSINQMTENQVTLLCADVMRMKVCQRTGDGRQYYEASSSAAKRLKRISDEQVVLKGVDEEDFHYAQAEYHIIASTYYYYQQQDEAAKAEMAKLESEANLQGDTTQWLYYNYMIGSGGLVDGSYEDVAINEFEHLISCYTLARRTGMLYFEANALQALAVRLKTARDRLIIRSQYADTYQNLISQHLSWMPDSIGLAVSSDSSDTGLMESQETLLPIALARHALQGFKDFKDLFQTACVYRTLGELEMDIRYFDAAYADFSAAIHCVNVHHLRYYPVSKDTLSVCAPGYIKTTDSTSITLAQKADTISVERSWIESDSIHTVPEWIAGIRQQLSLFFSACDLKSESDYNRNIYLDILECTSQNREMESRLAELKQENATQHHLLWAAGLLFLFVILLVVLMMLRLTPHDFSHLSLLGSKKRIMRNDKERVEELFDRLEEANEQCEMSRMRITKNKCKNAEKRAKVSLVQAVVPFLDRIINEVNRMNKSTSDKALLNEQLQYVTELSYQIVEYNDILTEWIKMERGDLSLQISTIALSDLFAILQKGHFAFDQQGVQLVVHPTEAHVKADEALTMFMLNTLADNARKFTPKGGTVTVDAREADDYVELSVSDTGCGMKPEDIDTIVNNKVYDATKIGQEHGSKGFGFGLMNCKGIIEKYKKTASLFSVCTFGIESEVGKGSRFFFRLPRVVSMLLFLLCFSSLANADKANPELANADKTTSTSSADAYYQRVYEANVEGDYAAAIANADTALYLINPDLVLYNPLSSSLEQPAELKAFAQKKKLDYQLIINLRNEVAVAALALHEWDLYYYNNNICITLHKLCNQDTSLPTYCDELQEAETATRQLTALLIILSLVALLLFIRFIRRRRHLADQMADEIQKKIDNQQDELSHLRFEDNRLYVQNQVLDNCLSTIKHESMYYPARIRQLADRMLQEETQPGEQDAIKLDSLTSFTEDLQQLTELTAYYKQLYTLLSSQAERQVAQTGMRRDFVSISQLINSLQNAFKQQSRKAASTAELTIASMKPTESCIRVDATVLGELFQRLFAYVLSAFPNSTTFTIELQEDAKTNLLNCQLTSDAMCYSDEEAHNLFYPSLTRIPLLVVKQIIRDFDAMSNNPGLRLIADQKSISFTLPINWKTDI